MLLMLSELQPNDLSRHSHLCRPCQFHQCTLSSISIPMNSLLQLAFFLFQLSDNLTPPNSRIVLSKTSHPQYFYAPLHVLVICAPASTGKGRKEFSDSVLDTWNLSCPLFYGAEESFLSARSQQRPYSLCQGHRDSITPGLSRYFFMAPSELYLTVHQGASSIHLFSRFFSCLGQKCGSTRQCLARKLGFVRNVSSSLPM